MPLFFFDLYDGEDLYRDAFGVHLDSVEEVADEAAALLPDVARDALPGPDSQDFAAFVRDENDCVVYRAALLFRAQRMGDPDGRASSRRSDAEDLLLRSRITRAAAQRVHARLREDVDELLAVVDLASRATTRSRAEREARS